MKCIANQKWFGGHLQTIWAAKLARSHRGARPVFVRERWPTPDGDFVDADWLWPQAAAEPGAPAAFADPVGSTRAAHAAHPAHLAHSANPADLTRLAQPAHPADAALAAGSRIASPRGLLVLFHGLEGSSASHYALAFADWARREGLALVVPHFRGCSGAINRTPRAYHSGDHSEIDWMLAQARERTLARLAAGSNAASAGIGTDRPARRAAATATVGSLPVYAVGVSLGGNALMRWAGQQQEAARGLVRAVAAISAPLDLTAGGHALGRGLNRWLYTPMFLRTMKPKARAKLAQHPGLFDGDAVRRARTLYAFDDAFTAPLHGFDGVLDYWARASAKPGLRQVAVPALLLNARNDPFVPAASLPQPHEVAPCVTLWQPAQGGHVGFVSGCGRGHVHGLLDAVGRWLLAQEPLANGPSAAGSVAGDE